MDDDALLGVGCAATITALADAGCWLAPDRMLVAVPDAAFRDALGENGGRLPIRAAALPRVQPALPPVRMRALLRGARQAGQDVGVASRDVVEAQGVVAAWTRERNSRAFRPPG